MLFVKLPAAATIPKFEFRGSHKSCRRERLNFNSFTTTKNFENSARLSQNNTAIMAAVEATAQALEQTTISKTKELKGVNTPHAQRPLSLH
jgi:hypothetical protein